MTVPHLTVQTCHSMTGCSGQPSQEKGEAKRKMTGPKESFRVAAHWGIETGQGKGLQPIKNLAGTSEPL